MHLFEKSYWKEKIQQTDWKLFVLLVLVLNVKLVVKLLVLSLFFVWQFRKIQFRRDLTEPHFLFYTGLLLIGMTNFMLQLGKFSLPLLFVNTMGALFWVLCAVSFLIALSLVRDGETGKMLRTLDLFFLLHIGIIILNLMAIMVEIGDINPYTYKGLNQKYYMSTGDFIKGISLDSPVSTAMICAFGVLYFLQRAKYAYAFACMAGLLIMASNLTNFFLLGVLVFLFFFKSNRNQKSMTVVFIGMMLIFTARISPQNNEHIVSFVYKLIGKAYYLPPVKTVTREELKQMPDSVLSFEEKRKKTGLLYIDSVNGSKEKPGSTIKTHTAPVVFIQKDTTRVFYEYRPSAVVAQKENRFAGFLKEQYGAALKDSLQKQYDWEKPGKWIGYQQLCYFLKARPWKLILGNGMGNFSSRLAFKATALEIAGAYPQRYVYIHPDFKNSHLFTYLNYHAQWQIKHTAANTPDAVYAQLLGEYGIAGVLLFLLLFVGYSLKQYRLLSFAFPVLMLLLAACLVDYWYEQLSVVILFEVMLLIDIKLNRKEGVVHAA
ncbi:MAG: hypothetical protein RLZZ28_1838 [Bacteroidota bacterium]